MYQYRARVNRIIDGDSVVLDIDLGFDVWMNNQNIRIYGIDTPECRTRNLDEKSRGLMAKKHVESLLPIGDIVTISTHKDRGGKFGRILAEIVNIDGIDIGLDLLNENLAVEYYGQSKEEIAQQHLDNREILILEQRFNPDEL
jgi:endonuclease YncB( thermonuclease family)